MGDWSGLIHTFTLKIGLQQRESNNVLLFMGMYSLELLRGTSMHGTFVPPGKQQGKLHHVWSNLACLQRQIFHAWNFHVKVPMIIPACSERPFFQVRLCEFISSQRPTLSAIFIMHGREEFARVVGGCSRRQFSIDIGAPRAYYHSGT